MKLKIGITGGIGSGKSYVCHLLENLGHIPIYYCDEEAKRLNEESPVIRTALCELVGPDVYLQNGSLNKPVLINYLFASAEHAQQVNAIIHPVVKDDFLKWAEKQQAPIVALEAALLFEASYQDSLDYTILVTAPEDLRIRRILKRDQTTETAARKRIQVQSSDEEKKALANFIINNDETQPLQEQIESVLAYLRVKLL